TRPPPSQRPPAVIRGWPASPGGSFPARKGPRSTLALSQQRAGRLDAIHDVARLLGLHSLGQTPQCGGVGEDLRRLPRRQVLLDRQQHRLLHAPVLALSRLLELIFEFGRKPESHRHGTMIPKRFRFIPQMISHAAVAALVSVIS